MRRILEKKERYWNGDMESIFDGKIFTNIRISKYANDFESELGK